MSKWRIIISLSVFVSIFYLSFFKAHSVFAVACSVACGGSITCDAGLDCYTSVCYNPVNECSGSLCVGSGGYNAGQPCNNTNKCTPAGSSRTSIWTYGSCSVSCGNSNTRLGTCTAQNQNTCTAPACTSPAGAVGSTYPDTNCACVGAAPQTPNLSPVGPTSCTTTGQVSVNWTFGTGGCGGAWGFACSTPSNTFSIKDGAATIVSGIPAGTSPYSRTVTLTAGLHQISVCASNGATTTCSGQSPVTVSVDTTPPAIPTGTVTFVPDNVNCPDKFFATYSWNAVSDSGCGGLNTLPYWDQISTNSFTGVVSTLLNNTWVNPTPRIDQSLTPYPPNTTLYFHVRSRDSFNQQSNWSATDTIVVPTPSPYPAINISGSFAEDIGIPNGTTCVSNISINPLSLVLQPTIIPSNGVTSDCSLITATDYSCTITINNQQGACVNPNINITMGGSYSGYSSLGWRAGGVCAGAPVSYDMAAGSPPLVAPLFFQYSGGSGGGGGGGGAGGSGGWFKLKDTSFNSRLSGRQNFIPNTISLFDATPGEDSIANKNMMIGTSGLIVQENPVEIGANGTTYSEKNWYTNAYTHTNDVSYLKYLDYVKSRKDYKVISDLNQITEDGIYSIASPVSLSAAQFDGKKVVLVVTGGSSATFSSDFISTGSVAVFAQDIIIEPTVGQINAILIGENVTAAAGTPNSGLKIKGNLIDQSVFMIDRAQTDARKPSLLVIFDVQLYLNLLPYLSTSTYDWKQIQ